jgi:hypothetical protein
MPLSSFLILIVILRSSVAVGTSYGQCNLSSLRHEIPHNSAVGSFIYIGGKKYESLLQECIE